MRKLFSSLFLSCVAIILVIATVRCGGGGGGGDSGSGGSGGSVAITDPDSSSYSTACNAALLSGEAFISPTWSGCCTGSAETLTGVTVTWTNETTGESGKAHQSVRISYFFSTPFLAEHTWSAEIPLALGENVIRVTAADPSDRTGQDTITVLKSALSHRVTGKVESQNGESMSGIMLTLENGQTSLNAHTGADGTYAIDCATCGTYQLTPSSAMNYPFQMPERTVVVSDSDVPGQDFTAEAYSVSGRAAHSDGSPIEQYLFTLTGAYGSLYETTDSGGMYLFLVPNGTYTVEPSGWGGIFGLPVSFLPSSRTMTVDHANVSGQDFVN